MTQILEKLKSQKVINVRPIFTGTGDNRVKTNYIILAFRLNKLPRNVFFGRDSKRIVPYRVYTVQCEKCWWFGHRADKCTRNKVCKTCAIKGTDHNTENCASSTSTNNIKCNNCLGNHTADNKQCPIWIKQTAISKIRSLQQVGYKKAVEIYDRKNKNNNRNNPNTINTNNQGSNQATPGRSPYIPLTPTRYADVARPREIPNRNGQDPNLSKPTYHRPTPNFNLISTPSTSSGANRNRQTNPHNQQTHDTSVPTNIPTLNNLNTDSEANHNEWITKMSKSTRRKIRLKAERDRFSSSEDELVSFLDPREPPGFGLGSARARCPEREMEISQVESDPEDGFISQVIPRRGDIYVPNRWNNSNGTWETISTANCPQKISSKKPVTKDTNIQPINSISAKSIDPSMLLQAVYKILFALPDLVRAIHGNDFDTQFVQFTSLINTTLIDIQNHQNGR